MATIPNSDNICEFFTLDVLYRIPIYQRRYVWNDDNWKTLWKDIKVNSDRNSEGYPQNHFTGAIVTRKIEEVGGENLTIYEVIDGQQRLTTFQTIFCALRFVCGQMESDPYDIDQELKDYLRLEPALGGEQKLRPTTYDQDAFAAVVGNKVHVPAEIAKHNIYEAYVYFCNEIVGYVDNDYTKLHNLYTSITNNFHVVRIDAQADDASQKIFETLNATGRQLSEFDYLRNNLFLRVGTGAAADAERTILYQEYWTEFEVHYNEWSDNKLETFLEDFLSAKGYPNSKWDTRAFDRYQQYSGTLDPRRGRGIEYEIQQLGDYGKTYRRMSNISYPIGLGMQFYKDLDISDVPPFILYVISELRPDDVAIEHFFSILESYIVQSMLVGQPYQKRIQTFCDTAKARGHTFLNVENFQTSLKWPSEPQVKETLRQAGTKKIKLIRYILYRIECMKREKGHNVDIRTGNPSFDLIESLDHVMPKSWQTHWPLNSTAGETPEDLYFIGLYTKLYKRRNSNWRDDPSREGLANLRSERYRNAHKLGRQRIKVIQSIGNLTPLSKELNEYFGHASFEEKKRFFDENPAAANSVLTREIFQRNDDWDVQQILDRERDLLCYFFQIWPIR